ncbi:hypothetical protein [Marinicella sp. W31]|uniref:hypothetical protein n=1 Tax=Marinicella sp. W31 TaxID=3023713 RepID=UPI003756F2B2
MKKITVLILMTTVVFNTAMAGVCGVNSCNGKTNLLYVNPNTKIYVKVDADTSPLNCTLVNGSMTLLKTNPMQSEIYSMLLSANLADREVKLRIKDNSGICELLYVQLLP